MPEEGGKVDGDAKGDITMRFETASPPPPSFLGTLDSTPTYGAHRSKTEWAAPKA